jgi:hypothetical protein
MKENRWEKRVKVQVKVKELNRHIDIRKSDDPPPPCLSPFTFASTFTAIMDLTPGAGLSYIFLVRKKQ